MKIVLSSYGKMKEESIIFPKGILKKNKYLMFSPHNHAKRIVTQQVMLI